MLCRRDIVQVEETDTFLTAYRRLLSYGVRSAPVVDAAGRLRVVEGENLSDKTLFEELDWYVEGVVVVP